MRHTLPHLVWHEDGLAMAGLQQHRADPSSPSDIQSSQLDFAHTSFVHWFNSSGQLAQRGISKRKARPECCLCIFVLLAIAAWVY